MGHTQRKILEAADRLERANTENVQVMDESRVLECLETDLNSDDHYDPVVGIGNGILMGVALWIVLVTAVVVAL